MGQVDMNSEIVLLRQFVRQARVCISRKLCREAKLLRTKRGDEKQRKRNANKADRLINEVLTLKKISNDTVSKFGITNTRNLEKMLKDPSSDNRTRILAKVVLYKHLHSKIVEFTQKFPNYVSDCKRGNKKQKSKKRIAALVDKLRTKKKVSPENYVRTVNKETVSASRNKMHDKMLDGKQSGRSDDDDCIDNCNVDDSDDNFDNIDRESGNDLNSEEDSDEEHTGNDDDEENSDQVSNESSNENDDRSDSNETEDEDVANSKLKPVTSKKKRNEICLPNSKSSVRLMIKKSNDPVREKNKNVNRKEPSSKAINNIATVKRFADLLESDQDLEKTDSNIRTYNSRINSKETAEEIKKESDDFFMTSDGNSPYLSIAISKPSEDTEENCTYNWAPVEKKPRNSFGREGKFPQRQQIRRTATATNDRGSFVRNKFVDKHNGNVLNSNVRRENEADTSGRGNLHPSWEARRKQQEIMKQGFQGKKIVFGDD